MCPYYLLFVSETYIIQNEGIRGVISIKYPTETGQLHSLKGEVADMSEVTPKSIIPAPMFNYTTRIR